MNELRNTLQESAKVKFIGAVILLVCIALIGYRINKDHERSITVDEFANHSEIK